MTTVENATTQASAPSDEIYDPDDVGPRDSPMLKPMRPNLQPSPSPPPAVPLPQVSPDSSPGGRKGSNRSKNRPSQGDAVLVSFMDGGKRPDIAREAGIQALASDDEDSEDSLKGTEITMDKETDRDGPRQELDLMALAAGAVKAHNEAHTAKGNLANETFTQKNSTTSSNVQVGGGEPMEGVKQAIPSITTNIYGNARSHVIADIALKVDSKTSPQPAGELPPILEKLSPQSGLSNGNGTPITLPGLRDQLGDINHLEPSAADPAFAQSPQARPPPRFSTATGQGSPPPRSPLDIRRELPSPGRGAVGSVGHYYQAGSNYRRPSQSEGAAYGSGPDYSSSNTETPSTDQSTPATLVDRMSIDGITNPQIGGFQCTYPGCTAQPFQTQVHLRLFYFAAICLDTDADIVSSKFSCKCSFIE